MKICYETTETPKEDDVAFVLTRLRAYNRAQAGTQPQQKLAVFARNDTGEIVGGATGEVSWGWLYIELLWVDEAHRGHGVGSQLLRSIEDKSRQYQVIGFHVGTTDFQALDFYRKAGYEVWGELQDLPPGHINYALSKPNKD